MRSIARRRIGRFAAALGGSLAVLGTALPGQVLAAAKSEGVVKVVMAEDPGVTSLPDYVAVHKGFFAKHHVDGTLQAVLNIDAIPPGVASGQFQFGMSAQPVLFSAVHNGIDLVVTTGQSVDTKAAPISGVVVPRAANVHHASQLAGESVALPALTGNIADCFTNWLRKNHAQPSAVHLVQVALPNMSDQLQAKQVAAAVGIQPFISSLSQSGNVSLGDPCLSVAPSTTFSFQISSRSWATHHTAVVRNVQLALRQADAWIKSHKAAAKQMLATYTGVPPAALATVVLPRYSNYEPVSDLRAWYKLLKAEGAVSGPTPDLSKLLVEPLHK